MRKIFTTLACALLMLQANSQWFKPEDMTTVGVYYYPEAWDSSQWNRDFAKMRAMGFEYTHMAEFAWAFMEPEEGKYNFEWLDKAVALAAKNGLKVIMCTPTPCPPAWLVKKYPEVMVVNAENRRAEHGSREHYSWSSSKYRELSARIVTEIAKHYGNDSRIWGWQLDNEPSHYGQVDYNPEAASRFRQWLQKKYGTIDMLNIAWGAAFWSFKYSDFSEINPPNWRTQLCGISSPHAVLDFKRFSADECADYLAMQTAILRKNVKPTQFVTTNFMHSHFDVDPRRSTTLDFPTYTMYPVAGFTDGLGEQGFRLGDPWRISFANDFFRPIKGITGVMELQPGQVNWGSCNTQPYPGAIRAWLWNAFAGNLSLICSYRFRQPLYGMEQYHSGMVGTDGCTPSLGGMQFSRFISELNQLRKHYNPKALNPQWFENKRTAILFNADNLWDTQIQPINNQWSYERYMTQIYAVAKSLATPVDFIQESDSFSKYKVMIAPAYQLVDSILVKKWKQYVEQGGHLVLTTRTAQKDRNGHLWQGSWAAPVIDIIGANIPLYDMLPVNKMAEIKMSDSIYNWNDWADVLEPNGQTEVWATFNSQFYKGRAAVTNHKLGLGSVTYIGPATDDGRLEQAVLQKVYTLANLKSILLPQGLMLEYRNGFGVAINYNSTEVLAPIPANAKLIIGQPKLKTAEVVVWAE